VQSNAHKHADHETAIYVLSGESGMRYGEKLEHHLTVRAGDFLYIPADMPHLPYNQSESESCVAVIARTDPTSRRASCCCQSSMEFTSRSSVLPHSPAFLRWSRAWRGRANGDHILGTARDA
jgi:uncharacterized cupin superfamily protein